MNADARNDGYRRWVPGAIVAFISATVYLSLRPPIYDSDGYGDLISALSPHPIEAADPAHLLSIPIQMGMVALTGAHPYAPTEPFQVLGIVLTCFALLVFYTTLMELGASRLFAVSASFFLAMSPKIWYVAYQNKPYPLLFVALTLFLLMWAAPGGDPPKGLRLAASGLFLGIAIVVHQAAVFAAPAAAVAIVLYGKDPLWQRVQRSLMWGAGTGVFVLTIYVWVWYAATSGTQGFLSWSQENLQVNGPLQFRFPFSLIQAVIGISGAVVNDVSIRIWMEDNLAPRLILGIYGMLAVLVCLTVAGLLWFTGSARAIVRGFASKPIAGLGLLTIVAWSAIVIGYEPIYSTHWAPILFPLLVLIALAIEAGRRPALAFAAIVFPLSAVNLYLNHAADVRDSRNAPERLAAAIDRNLAKNDIFIVLANEDWYGDVEYEMLFRYLHVAPDNRGTAILNDFVIPAKDEPKWRETFAHKIDSTLKCGGHVFVASHVVDPDAYNDLGNTKGAYAPKTDLLAQQYAALDGPALFREVESILRRYPLHQSRLKLGEDPFFVIEPIPGKCDPSDKNATATQGRYNAVKSG